MQTFYASTGYHFLEIMNRVDMPDSTMVSITRTGHSGPVPPVGPARENKQGRELAAIECEQ